MEMKDYLSTKVAAKPGRYKMKSTFNGDSGSDARPQGPASQRRRSDCDTQAAQRSQTRSLLSHYHGESGQKAATDE